MISILPTTASGLSAEIYRVDLPGEINPTRPRSQKITTTLDGGAAVTTWAKNNAGASQSIQLTISQAKYKTLQLIDKHTTVFEWLVLCEGRRYVCTIDVQNPVDITIGGLSYKQIDIVFVIVEDNNA